MFKRNCLKHKNATSTPLHRINTFIDHELDTWSRDLKYDFIFKNCLFGGLKLATNFDRDKYRYGGYDIGFDLRSEFSWTNESVGKNVIIFGVDMCSYVGYNNRGKGILFLGEGPTQELHDSTLTAEAQYSIIFSR